MGNFRRYGAYDKLEENEEEKDAAEREAGRDATMHEDEVYDEVPQMSSSGYYIIRSFFGI